MATTLLLEMLGSRCGKHEKPTLKGRTHEVPEESKGAFRVRMWDWSRTLKNVQALSKRKGEEEFPIKMGFMGKTENFKVL